MLLQEQHKLKISDKLSDHLPNLPSWSKDISLRHLLQYSSGLPKVEWDKYFSKGQKITHADVMSDLEAVQELDFEPGTDYLYSNHSPILLTQVVEKVSQQAFNTYIQENIFKPLNLSGMVINDQFPYPDKNLMAMPFNEDFVADPYQVSLPSMFFSATALDMHKWFKALDSFSLLSKESVYFLSQTATEGSNIQSPLGSGKWIDGNFIEHAHHGSTGNYECFIQNYVQEGVSIILLTNQKHGNLHRLAEDIYELMQKQH